MVELLPPEVQELLQVPTTVFAQSPADMRGLPRGRGGPEHRWHRVNNVKQLMLAHLELAFGLFECVDVSMDAIPTDDIAAVISKRLRPDEMPMVASVVPKNSVRVVIGNAETHRFGPTFFHLRALRRVDL